VSPEIVKLIITWLPFLVLIGVWIFLMRRIGGGSSFQNHCREHMADQTETQRDIARHLDRIATAREQRKP
jgi:ATP-dependent Zn protease